MQWGETERKKEDYKYSYRFLSFGSKISLLKRHFSYIMMFE